MSDFRFRGQVPRTWPEQVRLRGQLAFKELGREREGGLGKKKKPRAQELSISYIWPQEPR